MSKAINCYVSAVRIVSAIECMQYSTNTDASKYHFESGPADTGVSRNVRWLCIAYENLAGKKPVYKNPAGKNRVYKKPAGEDATNYR